MDDLGGGSDDRRTFSSFTGGIDRFALAFARSSSRNGGLRKTLGLFPLLQQA